MFRGQPSTWQENLDILLRGEPQYVSPFVNNDFFESVARDAPTDGIVVEFGVATGHTINQIAEAFPERIVWGFDSFDGLPEDWNPTHPAGTFKQNHLPDVKPNVRLVEGLFSDTLNLNWEAYGETVAFCHVDCDLYSSSKTVIDWLWTLVVPGSIILFDELYYTYAGDSYKEHEYKVLLELVSLLRSRDLTLEFYDQRHDEAFAFVVTKL